MVDFCNIAPPSGFSEKKLANRIKKKSDSGHTRLRKKGTLPRREFTLTWADITSADKDILDAFFDLYEASSFNYVHFEKGTSHTVFFEDDDLDFEWVIDGHWKLKLVLAEA